MSAGAIRRISGLKFMVKNISVSPSVTKKNKPPLPLMISSGDCMFSAKNLLGLEKKKNHHHHHHHHHHQVLEIAPKSSSSSSSSGCCLRPQVKYSTWDEILRKTKRIDSDQVDDMPTNQHMMMTSPSLLNPQHVMLQQPDQELSQSAVKGSSPSVFNLKGDNNAKFDGFKSLKMHQGDTAAKPKKTVSMKSSTAKAKKTVNVVPRKSATSHLQADVPVLVRGKSNKASIFPSKRPRNQDNDDYETSALNLKRRKPTLTCSGVKPKPAESLETSPANSCQTVVSSTYHISEKAVDSVNNSSATSSAINIPADKQPKAVFKNAVAHSNTIRETSPKDDDCGISPIIDEHTRKGWLPGSLWKKLSLITRKRELPGSPWRR